MTSPNRSFLRLRTLLILMALLTGMTWLIGTQVDRYTVQTSAVPAVFPGASGDWRLRENWKDIDTLAGFSVDGDSIRVERTTAGISTVELRVPLPEKKNAGTKLLASAELSAEAVSGGEKVWHGLLYTIWFYDKNGDRIRKAARTVQALRGNTSPAQYSREIELPAQAVEAGVGLRMFESTGTAIMRQPSLQVVAPWAGYRTVILGVLAVWSVFALTVLISLAKAGNLWVAIIPIAVIAVIAAGVSMPSEDLKRLTLPIEHAAGGALPYLRELGLYSVSKIGHALAFALLALLSCCVKKRLGASWLGIVCFLILLALLTEGVQLFFVGRSTRGVDMMIDLAGASVGAATFTVLWLLSFPFRRR